jgi:hypothetical protein
MNPHKEAVAMRNAWRRIIFVPILAAFLALTGLDGGSTLQARAFPKCAWKKALADSSELALPAGVKAVWNLETAHREATATRESVCLNGLWRWQPAQEGADVAPTGRWGFFKVPGFWPGRSSYDQEDCQTHYPHPSWKDANHFCAICVCRVNLVRRNRVAIRFAQKYVNAQQGGKGRVQNAQFARTGG